MKKVWCFDCAGKSPAVIRAADHLVFVRENYYNTDFRRADKDRRLLGVCVDCLALKNDFQRSHAINEVNYNHPDLVKCAM